MEELTRKEIEEIKKTWKEGMRVRLLADMQDPYNKQLVAGSEGTVSHVDDVGTIFVHWDCGSGLGIVPTVDSFEAVISNLGVRIAEFGQMMDKADKLIEYVASNGGREGKEILSRMSEINNRLGAELRMALPRLIPAVADNMMQLKSDEQYADFLAEKFDEGEYQFVGMTVEQLEKKANEN